MWKAVFWIVFVLMAVVMGVWLAMSVRPPVTKELPLMEVSWSGEENLKIYVVENDKQDFVLVSLYNVNVQLRNDGKDWTSVKLIRKNYSNFRHFDSATILAPNQERAEVLQKYLEQMKKLYQETHPRSDHKQ